MNASLKRVIFLQEDSESLEEEQLPDIPLTTLMRTRSEAPDEMQASKNRVKFLESPDGWNSLQLYLCAALPAASHSALTNNAQSMQAAAHPQKPLQ